jgi:hypothetical protein
MTATWQRAGSRVRESVASDHRTSEVTLRPSGKKKEPSLVKRLLMAASGAAAATAFTFVLAGPAHAAVGEIVLIQSDGGTVLSTSIEHVDNVANPITIAASETPGATDATVENFTDQTIRVTVNGLPIIVIGPQKKASVPETGTGEISILVPAGT